MRKEDALVTPENVSMITMQLFCMELEDLKSEYVPFAHSFTEQLIDDWDAYTRNSSATNSKDRAHVYQMALMQTVSVFLDALKPAIKKKLENQLNQEARLSSYITYKQNKATLFHQHVYQH